MLEIYWNYILHWIKIFYSLIINLCSLIIDGAMMANVNRDSISRWTTFIFSIMTAGGVIYQGIMTTKQLKIVADQLTASERNLPRAWLYAELIPNQMQLIPLPDDPGSGSKKGFQFEASLKLHNYGKVPCQIISLSAKVYVSENVAMDISPLRPTGLTTVGYKSREGNLGAFSTQIIAADEETHAGRLLFPFRDMSYVPASLGAFRTWMLVKIIYRDPFGASRETSNFIEISLPWLQVISDPNYTYWH
jgi:hypothetical protein